MGQCVQALMMRMVMKMKGDVVGGVPGCCVGEDFQS